MVRTKDEALFLVDSAFTLTVTSVTTVIDKEIDDQFDGQNTVTVELAALTDEDVRNKVEELYIDAGWTVVLTDLGATWRIELS